jgi:hypothetical protein
VIHRLELVNVQGIRGIRYTKVSTLREPLLAPLAAIAAGIVVSRFVSFGSRELLSGIAAFLILGVYSLYRESRLLAVSCALFALMMAGSLTDVIHRPGPGPEIEANSRTTLIVSGCVVQPPVFSEGREQFVLASRLTTEPRETVIPEDAANSSRSAPRSPKWVALGGGWVPASDRIRIRISGACSQPDSRAGGGSR